MQKSWSILLGAVLALALFAAGFAEAQDGSNNFVIRVRGADSVAGRVDKLAKIFMKEHPQFNIIVSGGSKEIGLSYLIDKTSEVAMAPRRATDQETKDAASKGVDLVERLIGYGGIAVVVNSGLPLDDLAVEQVQNILKGEHTRWSQVGGPDEPIELFMPGEIHAGTLFFIRNDLLGGAVITNKAENVGSFESILRKVGTTKGGIGLTRVRDALESSLSANTQFKVLAIKKTADSSPVKLSRSAIADGTYPIKRPFFLYLDRRASPEVRQFVDFVVDKGWGPQRIE
ncbi:MAG TPA: substrate-binding domain-containing protein [Desulfomonilaceae bacterium]|nr:substrate-binding domain-containing protein [Desulfomonilaceae bacterium]